MFYYLAFRATYQLERFHKFHKMNLMNMFEDQKNKLLILSVCYFFLPLGIVPLTTVTRSTPCVAMFDRFWPRFQVARPRTKRQIGHFEVQHDAIAQKMQNALKMHSKCIK
jgi:hypothetical protein